MKCYKKTCKGTWVCYVVHVCQVRMTRVASQFAVPETRIQSQSLNEPHVARFTSIVHRPCPLYWETTSSLIIFKGIYHVDKDTSQYYVLISDDRLSDSHVRWGDVYWTYFKFQLSLRIIWRNMFTLLCFHDFTLLVK